MLSNFEEELISLQNNMKNFAYQLTLNSDEADDLTQETMLKVLSNKDKYTENTNLKGWVFTIMRNIFINNYRRKTFITTIFDNSANTYYLDLPRISLLETPEGAVAVKEIVSFINAYDKELRTIFTMYIHGYKYEEIAKFIHKPVGTIKSMIFRMRRELREKLKDYRND